MTPDKNPPKDTRAMPANLQPPPKWKKVPRLNGKPAPKKEK